jgi:hypothetical protein
MEIARHRGSRFVGNESSRYHLTAEGGLKPRYGARLSAAQASFPKCQTLRFRLDEGMQDANQIPSTLHTGSHPWLGEEEG